MQKKIAKSQKNLERIDSDKGILNTLVQNLKQENTGLVHEVESLQYEQKLLTKEAC